ncbi:MAG: Csp1 family four helix bundle copper storage protein [Methylocystis sp.]
MERRGFVTAVGFAALSSPLAVAREAAPKPAAPEARQPQTYAALARASSLCLAAGQDCLRRALVALAAKDASFTDCANSAADVVAACGALVGLAGLSAPYAPAFARTVADICLACKKDCDKLLRVAECAALSTACAACAAECAKAAG